MDCELRKQYNKKYYETNKSAIKAKLLAKVTCSLCNRTVNHQNLKRHQTTRLCLIHRIESESQTEQLPIVEEIDETTLLKQEIAELCKLINEKFNNV